MAGRNRMMSPRRSAARASSEVQIRFLKALTQARNDAGLTQAQLADLIGITEEWVREVERLDADPTLADLRHYLTAIGATFVIRITLPESREWGVELIDEQEFTSVRRVGLTRAKAEEYAARVGPNYKTRVVTRSDTHSAWESSLL